MDKWVVRNARIVTSTRTIHGDLAVDNGLITGIGPNLSGDLGREINADGKRLIPGLIDPHTHFELPVGNHHSSDDFDIGTQAALYGGVTTIIDFTTPFPSMNLEASLDERLARSCRSRIDYTLHNTVTGWTTETEQHAVGCIDRGFNSFKFFTAYEESGRRTSYEELLKAAEFCAHQSAVMLIHAEDQNYLNPPSDNQGDSFQQYHDSRPEISESAAIAEIVKIQQETNAVIYIVHLSSGAGLNTAYASNLHLETCPHYLALNNSIYQEPFGYRYAVAPPLRHERNLNMLWDGIADGRIGTIGTDHCPFTPAEQDSAGDHFRRAPFGLAGVETLLPLLVTFGIERNRISWENLVKITSENTAKIFGLYPHKGNLDPGSDADFVLMSDTFQTVEPAMLHSSAAWNPYTGYLLTGWPHTVVSRGKIVMSGGKINREPGRGTVLKRFSSV